MTVGRAGAKGILSEMLPEGAGSFPRWDLFPFSTCPEAEAWDLNLSVQDSPCPAGSQTGSNLDITVDCLCMSHMEG